MMAEGEHPGLVGGDIDAGYKERVKQNRYERSARPKEDGSSPVGRRRSRHRPAARRKIFKELESTSSAANLDTGVRIDAATPRRSARSSVKSASCRARTVRPCSPRRTQALVVTRWAQARRADHRRADRRIPRNFMLHYNFPPTRRRSGPHELARPPRNRPRQAGLARAARRSAEEGRLPYTIRIVSEITESNGSSSMATVCGSSLALMDAGAPLARPVAGIAMGLIKEGERFAVISDILVTRIISATWTSRSQHRSRHHALQMDIKIPRSPRRSCASP